MTQNRVVLCMKWGTLYSAQYVNVLYKACRANLTGDFQFICLTDDAQGLNPGITAHPIPDIGCTPAHFAAGAWPKLSVFAADLYGLSGRALFIDLDMVIWGPIDTFFTYGSGIIALDSAPWRYKNAPPRTGTAILGFDLGDNGYLVDLFVKDRDNLIKKYHIEQNFIHSEAHTLSYWPNEWINSYKYHLRPPIGLDRFYGPKPPKDNVKILCFHGKPRPIDLIQPPTGNWDCFPHYGSGPVDWMLNYWTQHGGRL